MKSPWFDEEQDGDTPTGFGPQLLALGFAMFGILLAAVLLATPQGRNAALELTSMLFVPSPGKPRLMVIALLLQAVVIGAILALPIALAGLGAAAVMRTILREGLWAKVPFELMGLIWGGGGGFVAVLAWWMFGRPAE